MNSNRVYNFGPFSLDTARRLLLNDGVPVQLREKVFETLLILLEADGGVVGKDEFMEKVWPDAFVEENSLTRNISELRKALSSGSEDSRYVETVPKRGYRFAARVDVVDARNLHSQTETQPDESRSNLSTESRRFGTRRTAFLVLTILLFVALAGVFIYRRATRGVGNTQTGSPTNSIAVLPFRSIDSGERDYLGLGMADALITKLSNLEHISVKPTSAIRRYAQTKPDALVAGRELGVDSVLEGNMQIAGDRIRVTVQLMNVTSGSPSWAGTFEEKFTDVFTLQDSIAEKVSAAVKGQITAAERERIYRRYTNNVAAYQLYARGRSHLPPYNKDEALAAVADFEGALALDPKNALAHAGLAMASATMRSRFAQSSEVRSWEERAKQEAKRAVELDGNLAEAHEALGAVYRYTDFDWEHTIDESRRALELNPNLELPHHYLAAAFYHVGLLEQADVEARAGLQANPLERFESLRMRGMTALFSGKFGDAVALLEEAKQAKETTVTDWHLAQAYYYHQERDRSEQILEKLRASNSAEEHVRAQASLASFLAARGERKRADQLLKEIAGSAYMDHHAAYSIGAAYAQLGRPEEAVKWLTRAVETGLPCYPWFEKDPLLDSLRASPDFQRLMGNLKKYWESVNTRYASLATSAA
ncbi:MAG TPA: winged helix-turn-helix domain-containing protein [Pyrinomonadaceae bacterium]|nr:winged helix-turn-helix domain-containing protein [Pyrinomonadaceae bacterium]